MKKNNVFRMMIAAALVFALAFSFAACQANEQPSATPEVTEATTPETTEAATPEATEKPTTAAEKLIMVTNAEFPPYEFFQGGEIVGIDAEIAALIAGKLGMELEIQNMNFDSLIAAVQSGKADICMAGLTVSEDRKVAVDFSTTYATGKQVIIVKEDSPIASPDDLEGKKIGVQQSTTGDLYCTGDYGDEAMVRFNKGMDAVLALIQDKVDAVVIDNEPAKVFVSMNEGLKILETEYITEDYAVAVNKGKPELLEGINNALAELTASGELKAIIDKYIKAD